MPAPSISVSVFIEQAITAIIVIFYMAYEIRWGRLNGMMESIEALSDAVVALARVEDKIDTDRVVERVNGENPGDLIEREPMHGPHEVSEEAEHGKS